MKGKFVTLIALLSSTSLLAQSSVKDAAIDSLKSISLSEVSIIGTKADKKTPVSYKNVDKKEISKNNFGQDLPYLMSLTPSFVSTSDAGTGIGYTGMRIRGIDPTRINVMINGVPYNDSESQGTFFVDIPDIASSLENIQIQRGVGTSSNGAGAFGASVNLQTNYLSTNKFAELGISGGDFGTIRTNIAAGTGHFLKNWAIEGRISKINSNGYIDRSSVDLLGYFVQGGYFSDKTTIKLIAFGGNEVTGIAWNGIEPKDIAKYGRTYNSAGDMNINGMLGVKYRKNTDNYMQNHYQLVLAHYFTYNLKLGVTLHYTRGLGYTDEYKTGRKLKEYGLHNYIDPITNKTIKKVSLIREKYLDNNFYGLISTLEYTNNNLRLTFGISGNKYDGKHYGYIRWIEMYQNPVDPNNKYYDGKGVKDEASAFLKANYVIISGLNLYADLQYRFINYKITGSVDNRTRIVPMDLNRKFNFLNPKGGILYNINRNNEIYASVSVAQREPDRSAYTQVEPKDYPKPEKLVDYELGYRFHNSILNIGADIYYMDYLNQLVASGRKSDVGEDILQNIKNSYRAGIELTYGIKFLKYIHIDGSFSYSKNKLKKYIYAYDAYDANWNDLPQVQRVFENNDIAYSPNIVTSNMLSFQYNGWNLGIVNRFVDKQYLDNTQNEEKSIPSYDITDIKLGYQISTKTFDNIAINLSINNIFNKQYTSTGWSYSYIKSSKDVNGIGIYPQAGTNILMGMTIRL